jgi:tetratricopeptide (TPR) repeat protein
MSKYLFNLMLALFALSGVAGAAGSSVWSDSYALESNGQYEKAAALIAPLMGKGEESELAVLRYGWLNYLQGNHNDAIRAYKRALERNPRSFDARLGVALPLMAQQRWNEAARYLNQVIAQSPYNYPAHVRLMACEEGLRKWETLAAHSMKLAAYYPSDATIWSIWRAPMPGRASRIWPAALISRCWYASPNMWRPNAI